MKNYLKILTIVAISFAVGLFLGVAQSTSAELTDYSDGESFELPQTINTFSNFITGKAIERPSPKQRVTYDKVEVYSDKVILDIQGAVWASFTDTNSMDPVIDENSYALEIVPEKPEEIQVGDIISYNTPLAEGTIIHRVVDKGFDEAGTFFIAKGDNLPNNDPGKIRFNQIQRVVVGVLY